MSERILYKGPCISNDTWVTGLNNNDCIIGPSGTGKTRSYVLPNILQCSESVIVTSVKDNLCKKTGQGPAEERLSGHRDQLRGLCRFFLWVQSAHVCTPRPKA